MSSVLALALLAAAAAAAQPATSVYTALDLDSCEVLEIVEEGESVRQRCPGFGGVPLFVSAGDGRFDVDAGIDNGEWESLAAFNAPGGRIEWRLRGGRPFAIIFRLTTVVPGQRATSALMVETIGQAGRPGCQIASIDGAVANANAVARAIADRRAGAFRCGTDRPERRTR